MLGAIAGDIIGSCYEVVPTERKDFSLFGPASGPTDDTVLTVAVADSLLHDKDLVRCLHEYYDRYPGAGYGQIFAKWAKVKDPDPYNSWGNGSAMRVSPIAWFYDSLEEVAQHAARSSSVTHDHEEGIEAAVSVACCIFLARTGSTKEQIANWVRANSRYNIDRRIDEIRPDYSFQVYAVLSVPEAIIAFLESISVEDAIRNAVSLGGDADTQACIAGSIAEAFYGGLDGNLIAESISRLDPHMQSIVMQFTELHVWPKMPKSGRSRSEM